jgi:glycosyltransferase involved in cell wall biosynthesis
MNKKLRILFIPSTVSNGGGSEKVLSTLVNNLDKNLYQIDVIEVKQFLTRQERLNPEIHLLPPMIKANNRLTNFVMEYIFFEHPEIIKPLFKLYGYDIIVTWNSEWSSYCLRAFDNEIKIAWFHGDIYDLLPNKKNPLIEKRRKLQDEAWKKADKIITISNKSLQSLKDIFFEFTKKTQIICNGLELTKIYALSQQGCAAPLPDSFEKNCVICAGRLDSNKNFELLIRAVSKTIHSGINCHLVILGKGELQNHLENIADAEGIGQFVFFAGYQNNPYPYFKKAKIFCISSFSEGFPTVVLEAMILGKPFVTTPIAGASEELADNGRCGLVSDWDIDEYSECIKKLLTNDDIYTRMSANCIKKAQEYSVEKYVANFDTLIQAVIQQPDLKMRLNKPKENSGRLKELWAFFVFASAFVVYNGPRVSVAFQRLIQTPSITNVLKLVYRSVLLILHCVFFPVFLKIGVMKGFGLQKENAQYHT